MWDRSQQPWFCTLQRVMKAHPPVTAEPSSNARSEQARPSRFVQTMRRVAIGAAGLAVAVLAAAACVLSFDDLRALAMQAGARADFAYLYPAAFDALLVIALISFMLLSTARPLARVQAGFVLFVLLAAASWANVSMAMRFSIDARLGAVIVGVVPWVMLLIGLWLLTLLIKHAQVRRAAYDGVGGAGPRDIVPFDRPDASDGDTVEHPRPDFARPASAPITFEPLPSPTEATGTTQATGTGEATQTTTPSPVQTVSGSSGASGSASSAGSSGSSGSSGEQLGVDHEPPVPGPATRPSAVTTSAPAPPAPASASPWAPLPADAPPTPSVPPRDEQPGRGDPAASTEAGEGGRGRHVKSERALADEEGHAEASRTEATSTAEPEGSAWPGGPAEAEGRRPAAGSAGDVTMTSVATADTPPHGERDDAEGVAVTSPVQGRERPKRPIQWGDLLRPPQGDVLVHPRPGQEPGSEQALGRAEDPGQASQSIRETSEVEETDWEPEETEAGPQETEASSDEAEAQPAAEAAEAGVPVWPPDAIDTRPNVAMSPEEAPPYVPSERDGDVTHREEPEAERDTQPYPHLRDGSEPLGGPDPAHRAGEADPEEFADLGAAAGGPTVPLAPPSGRMRSTPVPPQE
ncbi:DUF2637 domain-containing protein [Thermopolyspora sp. NPDC052614]|uniref:DUF2637 domain-containing protein n=1 Tax=Thermopolyspora sp. NPDC052614 TaxID=3155682 RepID=UPI00344AA23A